MIYMVSYQTPNRACGNRCFDDVDEMWEFVHVHSKVWVSYSLFQYKPHPSGISTLSPFSGPIHSPSQG